MIKRMDTVFEIKTKNLKGQTIMLKITTKIMERQKVSNIILKRWRT